MVSRQERPENGEGRGRDVMLDPFGILFRGFLRYADRGEKFDHDAMAIAAFRGERRSCVRQGDAAIGQGGSQAFAFQPSDRLDGGGMGDAKAARDFSWPRAACAGYEIINQFGVIFQQCRGLGGARFTEAPGLGRLFG